MSEGNSTTIPDDRRTKRLAYQKAWYQAKKKEHNAAKKAWREANDRRLIIRPAIRQTGFRLTLGTRLGRRQILRLRKRCGGRRRFGAGLGLQ